MTTTREPRPRDPYDDDANGVEGDSRGCLQDLMLAEAQLRRSQAANAAYAEYVGGRRFRLAGR